jgi:hypothetical protein
MTPKVALSTKEAVPKIALSPNYKWYVVGMLWFCGFFNYRTGRPSFRSFRCFRTLSVWTKFSWVCSVPPSHWSMGLALRSPATS